MKYCILIIDGASGWPLPRRDNKTCLELANTPNLDAMAREGVTGLVKTVPEGMEPSSAIACMSVLGYDPRIYYGGRSGIEARAMGITWEAEEVVFRCNLVAVKDGKMWSYSSGHIGTAESQQLMEAVQKELGSDDLRFFPGIAYRHICKVTGHPETLKAVCTPPHDIPDQAIAGHLPTGPGGAFLREVMERSRPVLLNHPVNVARRARGDVPATTLWLFWATGHMPEMPSFKKLYGLDAVMTSAVDLLKGIAMMSGMKTLGIPGVTDGPDNDYAAQAVEGLKALERNDLVVIHVESPDEAGHSGSVEEKVKAIENIDREIVARLRSWSGGLLRVLITPDHPTPIKVQTHVSEPVPFITWGPGVVNKGAGGYSEAFARTTGVYVDEGHSMVGKLISGWR